MEGQQAKSSKKLRKEKERKEERKLKVKILHPESRCLYSCASIRPYVCLQGLSQSS